MKIINAGFYIDLYKEKLIENAEILIDKSSYKVLTNNTQNNTNTNCYEAINLSKLYVLPALIDSHVHFALNGLHFENSISLWDHPDELEKALSNRLYNTFSSGIGAVRDGGDLKNIGLKAKKLSSSFNSSPYVIACGEGLRRSGCYGSFLGSGLSEELDDEKFHLDKKLKAMKKSGIDQLKIILSGVVSFKEYGKVGKKQFNKTELTKIINSANTFDLPVMAHVNSKEHINTALSVGVHTIEHGYFICEKLLDKMAENKVYWVPTVVPVANQLIKRKDNYTKEQRDIITKTYKNQLKMLKKAVELGVKVGVGTDAGAVGVEHGKDYFGEIMLYKEAGLDNMTILKAACKWNREILNINYDKNIGFIGVKENPLENLEVLRNPEIIIK
ncbi:amidohydrolase family protein [Natranaerofaba carboxydovora]|uniref:amidohydrolase family protein n=1 Tax=Natranaerofaba carboxydovora TaxID=2742683 RepID=UPI001F140E5E|nr:amidohydrolase family protein [Natranaerofaba carboxydovora]UMZ74870.1 Amidohydrolase family protein [Natranaerofaba carboxydovora]